MPYTEQAITTVFLDGEQAGQEMKRLEGEAEVLRKKLQTAFEANDYTSIKKLKGELGGVNKGMKELQRSSFDVEKVLKNLSGATYNELSKAQSRIIRGMKDMTRGTAEYQASAKKLSIVRAELQKVNSDMGRTRMAALSLRSVLSVLAPTALIAGAVAGIGRLIKSLPDLATSMESDNTKAAVVFGDSLAYVEEQAGKLSKRMGVTNLEFKAMAANTADLLVPLDFSRKQAAEMSIQLQGLSGALSEWTGGRIKAKETSEILTKAMLGENEQLKQLGIAIRMDSEEYTTLVKNLKETKGYTSGQAQALATLQLIQAKSLDAQTRFNLEGNKLLRWQNEAGRMWRLLKERIVEYMTEDPVKYVRQEREEMNNLAEYIKSTTAGTKERREAVELFNTKYGKYLDNLLTEKSTLEDIRDAQNEANTALVKNIALKEQEQIVKDYQDTQAKEIQKILNESDNQKAGIRDLIAANIQSYLKRAMEVAPEEIESNVHRASAFGSDFYKVFEEFANQYGVGGQPIYLAFVKYIQQEREKQKKLLESAQVNAGILGVNPGDLNFFGKGGTVPPPPPGGNGDGEVKDNKANYQKMLKDLDEYYRERELILKKAYADEKMTKDQYNGETYVNDLSSQIARKELLEKYYQQIIQDTSLKEDAREQILAKTRNDIQDAETKIYDLQIKANEQIQQWRDKQQSERKKTLNDIVSFLEQVSQLEMQAIVNKEDADKAARNRKKKADEEQTKNELETAKEKYRRELDLAQNFGDQVGAVIGKQAAEGKLTIESFSKAIVKSGLDVLRIILRQSIVKATLQSLSSADSVATFGISGLAKAAVLTGLMEAAFSGIEAAMQMASGRYPVKGPIDGRTYNAGYAGSPKTGIYDRPTVGLFSERQPEMVIDGPTTRNLRVNYPGVISAIMAARTQFASGQYNISDQNSPGGQGGQSQASQDSAMLSGVIARLAEILDRGIDAKFSYPTVRDIRDRTTEISNIERRTTGS